ncbi:MAG TPA: cell wall-binding repeat-containing protein [Desulfitobacteriaceae bacterium]|nr:cell wall-binding repeat-containing protein [Desulfitobacteriaceae bacterium]
MSSVSFLDRISGVTKYETVKAIAERYNSDKTENVIVVGNNFADSITATVLAQKLNAPVLMDEQTAADYIATHLAANGTVWIIGGNGTVSDDFAKKFSRVKRINGQDRYDTSVQVAQNLAQSDTVVICSGENYPDALSISSIAAFHQWPVLLVGKNNLPAAIINYLMTAQPKTVYIIGGQEVISYAVEDNIRGMLPQASFERFQGYDRFDTSAQVDARFAPNPQNLYFTTGYDYTDAVAGSVLAAKTGDPLILVDPDYLDLPPSVDQYIAKLTSKPAVHIFGDKTAVNDDLVLNAGKEVQPAVQNTDFVNLAEYIPAVIVDLPYATTDNFTHTKLYDSNTAYLRKGTAAKLKKAVDELSRAGYHVKIWDAYRPPSVQFKMWSIVPVAAYVADPWTGYSNHSQGSAVDITLENAAMPTGFDDFSSQAARSNENVNAKYLESVMVKYGFVPLSSEWWHYDDSDSQSYAPTDSPSLAAKPILRPNGKETITISAVGDVVLGRDYRVGDFDSYYQRYGAGYFFSGVKDILANDTLTIANLEGNLTNETNRIDKSFQGNQAFWFKGSPTYTDILQAGSIEAVSISNNHNMDYLQKGLNDTVLALDKAGIASYGYDKTAVVGNVGLVGANVLGPIELGVDIEELKTTLASQIQTLKKQVPIVVVSFHWGTELNYGVDDLQKELGHFAIDQGSDLVVGTHPHVLEPIEQYKDRTIIYSLGNFVFGGNTRLQDRKSAIFQQDFLIVNGHIQSIGEAKMIPCYASGMDAYNDYRPVL